MIVVFKKICVDILLWSDLVFSIRFAICARVEIFCHLVPKTTSEDLFLFDFLINKPLSDC